MERRALDTTAGSGSIPTIQSGMMIDLLRNRVLLARLGATMLNGMVGDFEIPKQTAAGTAQWVAEAGAAAASNQTIGQVAFSPKTLSAHTDVTRKFVKQTSIDAEQFVRNDLTRVLAIELDRAGFNGSGTGAEPEGILQNAGITTVDLGANGGAPTWAKVVEMETVVAQQNADINTLAYVTNAQGRGKLKVTEKATGTAKFLWDDGNLLNGYQAHATQQIPANLADGTGTNLSAMVFGDFSTVFIALWGAVDVLVDPYSLSTSGGVRIVFLQDLDIKFRHAESLSKIVDMITA